jgi:hypothetical protein
MELNFMDKKQIFGSLSMILLIGVLFTKQGTNQWLALSFPSLNFLGLWKFGK